MRRVVRRFPFLCFYLAAWVIACGVMVVYAVLMSHDPNAAETLPRMFAWLDAHRLHVNALNILRFAVGSGSWAALLILAFAVAPTVAAAATLASGWGREGLGRWVARLKPWGSGVSRHQAGRVYAVLALAYVGGFVGYLWAAWTWGGAAAFARGWAVLGGSIPAVLVVTFASAFLDEGGLLEEMGWRGYALPLLQSRLSPLAAAVALGLLWDAWHLPREVPTLLGGGPLTPWFVNQGEFALLTVSLSIVIAYCVNRTGGSVLPAIIIHGGTNVWSKAVASVANATAHTDVRTWIVVVAAIAVVAASGRTLGRGTTTPDASPAGAGGNS